MSFFERIGRIADKAKQAPASRKEASSPTSAEDIAALEQKLKELQAEGAALRVQAVDIGRERDEGSAARVADGNRLGDIDEQIERIQSTLANSRLKEAA